MERLNQFLAERLWLQMVLSVLAAGALIMLLFPGESAVSAVTRAAGSSIGAVGVLLVVRRKEKRAAGSTTGQLVSLDARLRKGDVPSEPAEREAMRGLVEQRLRRLRYCVPALVGLTLMWGTLVALSATTLGARQTIGLALPAALFMGWLIPYGNLQLRRLHHMRDALGGVPETAGTAARHS